MKMCVDEVVLIFPLCAEVLLRSSGTMFNSSTPAKDDFLGSKLCACRELCFSVFKRLFSMHYIPYCSNDVVIYVTVST